MTTDQRLALVSVLVSLATVLIRELVVYLNRRWFSDKSSGNN